MDSVDLTKHSIDIRSLAIKGMPRKISAMVHESLVDIAHMRMSIERTNFLISRSSNGMARNSGDWI
jgi:hypothetical protein